MLNTKNHPHQCNYSQVSTITRIKHLHLKFYVQSELHVLQLSFFFKHLHLKFYVQSELLQLILQVLMLLTFCLLLLPLWESVIVLCFVVRFSMSILVLQSSWWGRESWLLCLICLPGVSWWLSGSSSRCHGVVCSLWLWYFLIILIYYFWDWIDLHNCLCEDQSNFWQSLLQ